MENVLLLFLLIQSLFKTGNCLCFTLPVVQNSKDNSGNYFLPLLSGEKVEVECQEGYKLMGDATLTCNGEEEGNWEGVFSYCVEENWKVISINKGSENTLFDPINQVIQLKFNEHSRPQNLRFVCNVHLFTDGDAADTKAYLSILYNFEDSQIIDSVVKYSSGNESCIFCLDFSVPNSHVTEVVTYSLATKSKTFYDGVPGSGQCGSHDLDRWNELVMSGSVTSLVYDCSVKHYNEEEEFGKHYSLAFRLLQRDDLAGLCSHAPDIEHISAVDNINTPVHIGTKVNFQCDDGYTLTGSTWGYCKGYSNMYNFEIPPKCSPEKRGGRGQYTTRKEKNKTNTSKESEIDDDYNNDHVAWALVSILLVTLISMGAYSAVLYKRPTNYKVVSMKEPEGNLLLDNSDKEEAASDQTEDSD